MMINKNHTSFYFAIFLRRWLLCICFLGSLQFGLAQGDFSLPNKIKKERIPFKLVNNLIVIPLYVNGIKGNFILDTGVSTTILFKSKEYEVTSLKNVQSLQLSGLGDGKMIEAVVSRGNEIRTRKASGKNCKVYLLLDEKINFSAKLGMNINGIVGHDFFRNSIVKINYRYKTITLLNPKCFKIPKGKKYHKHKLEFYKGKPFLQAKAIVSQSLKETIPLKLLIDTGGSDSFWFFENTARNLKTPENYIEDYLGEGISGSIYGKRCRIDKFVLGNFSFEKPIVSFLVNNENITKKIQTDRNGSLGGAFMKRFTVWFDYKNQLMYLRKNSFYKDKFRYNLSGIEVSYNGEILVAEKQSSFVTSEKNKLNQKISFGKEFEFVKKPSFVVSHVREKSPAAIAGVQIGDELLSINNTPVFKLKIDKINTYFYKKENKKIKLRILRKGKEMNFYFLQKAVL